MKISLICKNKILEADEKVVVTEVVARAINESGKKRKRTDVAAFAGDCFHRSCRSSHTNAMAIDQPL